VLGQKLDILLDPDNPLLPVLAQSSVDGKADNAISVVGRYKNGEWVTLMSRWGTGGPISGIS